MYHGENRRITTITRSKIIFFKQGFNLIEFNVPKKIKYKIYFSDSAGATWPELN